MEIGGGVQIPIVNAGDAVVRQIQFPRHGVDANMVRLEDGAELVVVEVVNRVVFMVVALGAIHGQPHEGLASVFNRVIEPGRTIEFIVTSGQKTGSRDRLQIPRGDFISGQHLSNHLVVAFVFIERSDDPVPPAPKLFLAVAHLITKAVPVRVTPDIHPVPGPSLTVIWTGEQLFHGGFPTSFILQLLLRGRQPDEVKVKAADENRAFGRRLGLQPALGQAGLQQIIDGIA